MGNSHQPDLECWSDVGPDGFTQCTPSRRVRRRCRAGPHTHFPSVMLARGVRAGPSGRCRRTSSSDSCLRASRITMANRGKLLRHGRDMKGGVSRNRHTELDVRHSVPVLVDDLALLHGGHAAPCRVFRNSTSDDGVDLRTRGGRRGSSNGLRGDGQKENEGARGGTSLASYQRTLCAGRGGARAAGVCDDEPDISSEAPNGTPEKRTCPDFKDDRTASG